MDIGSGINDYFSIVVVLACFVTGYIIKHYTKLDNNYIPLIMISVGIIVNTLLNIPIDEGDPGITVTTLVTGAVSGLASSGLYEMVAKSLGLKKEEKKEEKDK